MSEKQEKRRRLRQRLAYMDAFIRWKKEKPPVWRIRKYLKWKRAMPTKAQYGVKR